MITVHTSQSDADTRCANFIASHILQGQSLLLLSGGSVARDVYSHLASKLEETSTDLSRLTVGLIDERFACLRRQGEPWHAQSNMLLLKTSGLLQTCQELGARVVFPLGGVLLNSCGADYKSAPASVLDTCVAAYEQQMAHLFRECPVTIAVLGIGTDGHTAGIKPRSSASEFKTTFDTGTFVVGYQAADFTRITLTPKALQQLHSIIFYAVGEDKKEILTKLTSPTAYPEHEFPAAILKNHPHVDLFTDQKLAVT